MNINISNEDVTRILERHGYVIERNVPMYYSQNDDEEFEIINDLNKIFVTVAYHESETPKWKSDDYPRISEYENYLFDNVASRVIGKLFVELLIKSV